jgi:hypothetical protein
VRVGQVLLIVVGVAVALAVGGVALIVVLGWLAMKLPDISTEPVAPPLARLSVTRDDGGRVTEMTATLATGSPMAASVNLDLFEGFDPWVKPEEIRRRLGPPTGVWRVPPRQAPAFEGYFDRQHPDVDAPYYDRPRGRVTMRPFPTPEQGLNWVPVAYPKDCTLEALFPDQRLRAQIARYLSPTALTSLNLRAGASYGSLIVSLDSRGCRDVELSSRER